MSVEEAILEAVRMLAEHQQHEILEHARRLQQQVPATAPRRSGKGLWAGLGVDLSADEIDANQREMWIGFPREDF